jgi:hypothetical protein
MGADPNKEPKHSGDVHLGQRRSSFQRKARLDKRVWRENSDREHNRVSRRGGLVQYLLLMCFDETGEPEDDCRVPGPGADALAAWVHETEALGVRLLSGARLDLGTVAKTVRDRGGELLVTDGPFAETKDLVAGFQVIECVDLDQAMAVASTHPSARSGKVEVHRVFNDEVEWSDSAR